nr:LysR family transcriptional regulator [Oceanococcus sp. HetDA_MAG_MS8]
MRKLDVHTRTGGLDWDELRTVLAVHRHRSVAAAARSLQLQHSTLLRRLDKLETRLQMRLFIRATQGYRCNEQGLILAQAAAEIEDLVLAAERQLLGQDDRIAGVLRLTTSEILATVLLPRLLPDFQRAFPQVKLDIDVTNAAQDLERRQSDLAIRATRAPPDNLVGRRVGNTPSALYAHHSLLPALEKTPAERWPWLGYTGELAHGLQARWLAQHLPQRNVVSRFGSAMALQAATLAGAGVALLPCLNVPATAPVLRVAEVPSFPSVGIWLLNHRDTRGNARIRSCKQWLVEHLPQQLEQLENQHPPAQAQFDGQQLIREPRPN